MTPASDTTPTDGSAADSIASDSSLAGSSSTQASATSATTNDLPAFGWSGYAERVNGRFAMVGFVAVLLVEALSGQTFLKWAGFIG